MRITLIFAILIKAALERIGIPPLVGYLLLGMGMGLVNSLVHFLTPSVREVYAFLAELGIISLLFRVGLESNLAGLIRQLPHASLILLGNLSFSGILGFLAASKLLQLESIILVSAITCIASPLLLRPLLQKNSARTIS